jgi:hypothetical protein
MEKISMILAVVGLIQFFSLAHCQGPYKARISVELDGGQATVKPLCYAPEDAVVNYKFWINKSGKTGKATSYQAGTIRLVGGRERCLSQSSLAISPGDEYQIKVEVYKDGKLIVQDQVSYPHHP